MVQCWRIVRPKFGTARAFALAKGIARLRMSDRVGTQRRPFAIGRKGTVRSSWLPLFVGCPRG